MKRTNVAFFSKSTSNLVIYVPLLRKDLPNCAIFIQRRISTITCWRTAMTPAFTCSYFEVTTTFPINDSLLLMHLSFLGDPPMKAADYDGYMVLRTTLNGDRVPICRVDDLEITLVTPDLSVRAKLPTSENSWRSLSQIRAAELQCMQLPLALLSRHESEVYVTVETEKNTSNYLQSSYNQEQRTSTIRQSADSERYYTDSSVKPVATAQAATKYRSYNESRPLQAKSSLADDRKAQKPPTARYHESPKLPRAVAPSHAASDKLYYDHEQRSDTTNRRTDRTRPETGEKYTPSHRTTIRDKGTSSSSTLNTTSRSSSGTAQKYYTQTWNPSPMIGQLQRIFHFCLLFSLWKPIPSIKRHLSDQNVQINNPSETDI